MKRSLKSLLAIAASSVTTFGVSVPSGAAVVGFEDQRTFTGVYSQRLEATRSCSINVRPGDELATSGFDSALRSVGGTVIRLARTAGRQEATGNVIVEFDASGANGVYFEEDSYKVAYYDGDSDDFVDGGNGKITLKAEKILPKFNQDIEDEATEELLTAEPNLDQIKRVGRTLAAISGEGETVDQNKPGIVTGKLRGGVKAKDPRSLSQFAAAYSRPETTKAILNMAINDVGDYDGDMIIQATLVCSPLGLDNDESGGLRPILPD